MNAFWAGVFKIVTQIFGGIVGNVTPGLVKDLKDFLLAKYIEAVKTVNPWDDFFYGLLLDILSIPRPPPPRIKL